MMRTLIRIALSGAMLLVCGIAFGQGQERTIEWHPGTAIGPMVKGADGSSMAADFMALEIVNISVAGESVSLGQPFLAGADWMKGFSIRVKNISAKRIVGARLDFSLPEAKGGLGSNLGYGRGMDMGKGAQEPSMIAPGEEFELIRTEAAYDHDQKWIAETSGITNLNRVWLGLAWVKFEDGTVWFGQARMQSPVAK
jgi:hypothetical protein